MTDPAVPLEQRMLEAERRAREIAENAQAEAEAAREEAVRAREEAERAHRLETQARERLQVLVEAGVAMAASLEVRSVLAAATGLRPAGSATTAWPSRSIGRAVSRRPSAHTATRLGSGWSSGWPTLTCPTPTTPTASSRTS